MSHDEVLIRRAGTEVADGVYRFAADGVNWYLVADDGELTVVDAGFPAHWTLLLDGLEALESGLDDVRALILTHTDPDHIGFAERLRSHGVPVWVPVDEFDDALAGGRNMPARVLRHLWRPVMIRLMLATWRAGGFSAPAITSARTFEDGQQLDVPGTPTAIHVPGHTVGQTAFWFPDRRVLIAGDALVTVDVITGRTCDPRVGEFSDADVDQAKRSTEILAAYDDITLLPGHGPPWVGNLSEVLAPDGPAREAVKP